MKCKKCDNGELRNFKGFTKGLFICDNPSCLAAFKMKMNVDGTAVMKFSKKLGEAVEHHLGRENLSRFIKAQETIPKEFENLISIDIDCDCICCKNKKERPSHPTGQGGKK